MIPFRVIRSGLLLAGLLATLGLPLQAGDGGFSGTLSAEEQAAAGLTALTAEELAALDRLVANDLARARQLKTSALPGTLASRHPDDQLREAGLHRLAPEQLAKLNALVDAAVYARPQPRERPRLRDRDVLTEQGRLQVHGGLSFTYGWAGGGRSFRETSGWVSYYDPVTGIGVGFGIANFSGNGLSGYYPDSAYDRSTYPAATSYYSANPRTIFIGAEGDEDPMEVRRFTGNGASLRNRGTMVAHRGGTRH